MNEYEVIRTSTYFHDKIPCNIVPCKVNDIIETSHNGKKYHDIYHTIHADSLDDAIMMLRKEFDNNNRFAFVVMDSRIDGIEYCIEIYDDWRE